MSACGLIVGSPGLRTVIAAILSWSRLIKCCGACAGLPRSKRTAEVQPVEPVAPKRPRSELVTPVRWAHRLHTST